MTIQIEKISTDYIHLWALVKINYFSLFMKIRIVMTYRKQFI